MRGRLKHPARKLLAVSLPLLLAGCQYTATPADLLLTPQAASDHAALASAVQAALPPHAKLTLPDQGDETAAVRKADIDGDGRKEAIVTYVNEMNEEKVMVLSNEGGASGSEWYPWFTFAESSGYGVDWIEVDDLDDDGHPEVLIGWNSYDVPFHQVNIYTVNGQEITPIKPPTPLAELVYEQAKLGDIDGDDTAELILITHDREMLSAALHVYRLEGHKMKDEISTPIDGAVSGYYNLAAGQIAQGRYGLIMDAGIGAHSSVTTMLAWSEGKLKKIYPPVTETGEEAGVSSTFGGDGNHDGVLDIALLTPAPGQAEDVPYSDTLWIERRKQWDGRGHFDTVQERYVNYEQGYAIRFPDLWYNRVTISKAAMPAEVEDSNMPEGIRFEQYDEKTGRRATLFIMYAIPNEQWGPFEQSWKESGVRYHQLMKAAGVVYAVEWKEAPDGWKEQDLERFAALQPDADALRREFELLPER